MNVRRRTPAVVAALLSVVIAVSASPNPARSDVSQTASSEAETAGRCEAQLDAAIARFTSTLLGRDIDGYMRLWDDKAVLVLNSGRILAGRAAVREFFEGFFAIPGWTETFDERSVRVFECRTAYAVYDVLFEIPESGVRSPLVVSLSYTRDGGEWVLVGEQITSKAQ